MRYLVFLTCLLMLLACEGSEQVKTDPSFNADVQPVFTANCVSCHSGSAPAGNYDLSSRTGVLGGGTDTIPNVIAANADSSKLFQMLDAGLMPKNSQPLDAMKVATVRNWINKGARDN
jgi:hypothetical protein